MIIRIVKMTFEANKVAEFLKIFEGSKKLIRNMEGCKHLELLNDVKNQTVFFTYSHWENENDLNIYRNSELFKSVWSKTKILFAEKPEAWSVTSIW